jgi:hypothetical protein
MMSWLVPKAYKKNPRRRRQGRMTMMKMVARLRCSLAG